MIDSPESCQNIDEIRSAIDAIDLEVIQLIGKRFKYVKAASKFKLNEEAVKAPERFKNMLLQRRNWAGIEGLNPDVIEKVYRDLVNYFISEEIKNWNTENGNK
ncbi:isochorismate pyruvate lyase [Pedobacter psychrotolerans]|uniref:chorismate mutase n=1 Tax=Pedobacter psychrotolerans TaxID=1843235 RepID=A0A4R2HN09_9SPHI|nr:isochorismate lyase [Pedobacter psychrotolerans]TCO29245.1 isochorismate pyruvate lyase [Pedobacter psychrotolerans]GGE55298.1 isochorismate pyruvate lyase [Pedobacter psychrotolerans]